MNSLSPSRNLLALTAVFFGTAAYADDIADCYSNAEASHSGRSITVSQGQTTVLTSSDLASVFDKVAELHTDPTLSLQYNLAGRNALRDAMSCVFTASKITLSSVYLNQAVQNLKVRQNTLEVVDDTNQLIGVQDFTSVDTTCADGTVLRFQDQATQSGASLAFQVVGYGSFDLQGDIAVVSTELCAPGSCTGDCLWTCHPDTGESQCGCHGGSGTCDGKSPQSVATSTSAVIRAEE